MSTVYITDQTGWVNALCVTPLPIGPLGEEGLPFQTKKRRGIASPFSSVLHLAVIPNYIVTM
jgi:hypothetical protein